MAVDYLTLQSALIAPLERKDRKSIQKILSDCADRQKGMHLPFKEIILLDGDKRVFEAVSMNPASPSDVGVGASYSGINFNKNAGGPYAVLTLYRAAKGNPMGIKETEMAFELRNKWGEPVGWLLFKMDMNEVKERYNVDEDDLKQFRFEG